MPIMAGFRAASERKPTENLTDRINYVSTLSCSHMYNPERLDHDANGVLPNRDTMYE
jgi:hypothetical protein